MKNTWISVVAGVALMGTGLANAGPISLTWNGFSYKDGSTDSGYVGGNIEWSDGATDKSSRVAAGKFSFTVNSGGDHWASGDVIDAFCVDLNKFLITGSPVSYNLLTAESYFSTNYDPTNLDDIDKLYGDKGSAVVDGKSSAAFQLALWEIVNEDAGNVYDFGAGAFKATNFGTALTDGQDWLDGLGGVATAGYEFYVLDSDTSQDLLIVNPKPTVKVPEPGTLALVGLGLVGLLLSRRRA